MPKPSCAQCGNLIGFFNRESKTSDICLNCRAENDLKLIHDFTSREKAKREQEQARQKQAKEIAATLIVTTTHKIDGHYVKKYIGIETVEHVIGTGIFSEVVADVSDVFGARAGVYETKLQKAKTEAMDRLKFVAAMKGANAVIGIDIDYTEFTGNRIGVIINGTIVQIARIPPKDASKAEA